MHEENLLSLEVAPFSIGALTEQATQRASELKSAAWRSTALGSRITPTAFEAPIHREDQQRGTVTDANG